MKKYLLDTNLYIDAFRDPEEGERFLTHYRALIPGIHLSSVVAQELLAGAEARGAAEALQREVLSLFERTRRVVTPSHDAWKRCGRLMTLVARSEGRDVSRISRSFTNDLLLALSCRETGMTLLTRNVRDFRRIRRHVRFEFQEPWPDG